MADTAPTTGTGPTMPYADWMVQDMTLRPLEVPFRTHYGPGADQYMDRSTLDLRIETLPEGGGDPMVLAERLKEDAETAKTRHDEDATRLAKRKAEDLIYSRKVEDEKIVAKRKAEDDAAAAKAEEDAAAGRPHDDYADKARAEARKAEDEALIAKRKAEDERIAEAAKLADPNYTAPAYTPA